MAVTDENTRENIRALVREVLASVPPDELTAEAAGPEHVVVNSMKERLEREFERDESAKSLLTEDDLRGLSEGARLRVSAGVKMTPLARDIVQQLDIKLIEKAPREATLKVRSVAIGADHGGYELKEKIKVFLADLGVRIRDLGTNSTDPVDYPDIANEVARSVGSGNVDVGIIADGAGIGSAIAANKIPGVRAAACYSTALARNSREHNGANVLTLGSRQNTFEEVKDIIIAFLSSEISEERHKRRVEKIVNIDRQYRR